MQRTGGTSLTDLLMQMSEHRRAEHEPFNWAKVKPRQFWPITDAWNSKGDLVALQASLKKIFEERFLIKHCYELLNMGFNTHLMQVSASTPYKHVILLRRDEPSRLVSKFIAEAHGTWFKDYSREVFSEVARGERRVDDLPINRLVAHFLHSQQATKAIDDGLQELGATPLRIFHEDLYTGERDERLAHLHRLLAFLEHTPAAIKKHHDLIEEKVFRGGQNTQSVARYVPNLAKALEALKGAGCEVETSALVHDLPQRAAGQTTGPRERIAREAVGLADAFQASGPYLEIASGAGAHTVLSHARFANALRFSLSKKDKKADDGIQAKVGDPNNMRAIFAAGQFGTVFWINALAHDTHFWRTVDEIKRVLKPGGTLIVVTPCFNKSTAQGGVTVSGPKGNAIADATLTYRIHDAPDYWRISPQAVRDVIFDGFEVLDLKTLMMPPRIFAVGRKPLKKRA